MKINILKSVRRAKGEYHWGRRFAGRIHVHTSTRALIRQMRGKIMNRHQRVGPAFKHVRIALYAGAMNAHRAERRMCAAFHL